MITKIGNDMVKRAALSPDILAGIGGAALGALRAYNLSEDQKDALRAQYDINSGSFGMGLRNATRGALGAVSSGGTGAFLGAIASRVATGRFSPRAILATGALGAALGGWRATNKYSKGNADAMLARMDKIRNRQEERRSLPAPEIRLDSRALESLLAHYGNNY